MQFWRYSKLVCSKSDWDTENAPFKTHYCKEEVCCNYLRGKSITFSHRYIALVHTISLQVELRQRVRRLCIPPISIVCFMHPTNQRTPRESILASLPVRLSRHDLSFWIFIKFLRLNFKFWKPGSQGGEGLKLISDLIRFDSSSNRGDSIRFDSTRILKIRFDSKSNLFWPIRFDSIRL